MRTIGKVVAASTAIALTALIFEPAFVLADPTPVPSIVPLAPVTPAPAVIHVPGSTTVMVPGGTNVSVSLSEQLSSASATTGEIVPIISNNEVDVNGWLVIPKGSPGQATVTTVDKAGSNGHGGQLALTLDWIFSADGGKIRLSNVNHSSENGDNKGAASTATLLSWVLLGPIGFFAHNFVRGKDVTVNTDKVFAVFVDQDVHVDATQRGGAAAGFDH
jgi:hypothetical protein